MIERLCDETNTEKKCEDKVTEIGQEKLVERDNREIEWKKRNREKKREDKVTEIGQEKLVKRE